MRETAKTLFWSGLIAVGLFAAMMLACEPARADINPWSAEIAASGQGAQPAAVRVAGRHSHRIRVKFKVRETPDAPTGGMLRGVNYELASKAREIVSACGSRVVSGVRHTRVAGTRRMSLHASGLAVDMVGNPGCIYAHLRGWPGGYSTDYARARHVHISGPGGREDGARFAHRFVKHRYAHRHRVRFAARG